MNPPLLHIQNLHINFGDLPLVKGIDLKLEAGKICGLVGESGSGKTLSALSVMGLLSPSLSISEGSIQFYSGEEKVFLNKLKSKQLNKIRGKEIGMIFQEPMSSLNPSMRCGKQVLEVVQNHSKISQQEAKQRVMELLEEMKLPDLDRIYKAWPHELSGGQRQRVMIAMALACNPRLLIADEPTTALDVTVQKSILSLLLELKEKYKLAILFITHDLMVIKEIADQVSVMYQGKMVEEGSKDELMENPKSPYTKGLLASKPSLHEQPYRLTTVNDYLNKTHTPNPPKTLEKPSTEALFKIKKLSVRYNNKKAVDEVSFEVFKGETLGLVGESGCGKTSLGRAMLQLVDASSGDVEFKGLKLNQLGTKKLRSIRRKIQIVFQDPYSSLNPGKTVAHLLSEPLRIHQLKTGKEAIMEACLLLLEQVGLDAEALNKYPHEFSGGQRQRIGIARALACNPEFIILDESVSALDVSIQAQILNLLNDLKEKYRLTYVFISHDLTLVKYMSDRVIVMKDGEFVESGSAEKIYLNPANDYTKELIQAIPG